MNVDRLFRVKMGRAVAFDQPGYKDDENFESMAYRWIVLTDAKEGRKLRVFIAEP